MRWLLLTLLAASLAVAGCGQGDAGKTTAEKTEKAEKAEKTKTAKKAPKPDLLAGPPGEESAPMPPPVKTPPRGKRQKIKLPPPAPPPPRPEGEPKTSADFDKLSDAAAAGAPVDKPGAPPIQRLDAYKFRVGRVFLDRQKRLLEVPAKLNMTKGILEYYAVGSRGKLHEAVLELLAQPSHIHLALVLVGASPTEYAPKSASIITAGTKLELRVEWTDPETKKTKNLPAESLLFERKRGKAPKALTWRFLGSRFWRGRYVADMDRSVIGLVPDPSVVITVSGDAGNPYRGDSLGFEVNTKNAPPKGTEMKFIIKVVPDAPAKR